MSNQELTVYSRMADPLAFVREFGTEIALSKMFGCANEAQGKVLAMACMCEGENPIALSRKYHIIQNNLSMKADAMLAELRARGGKHKIIERTADKATVEITYDGQTYTESISWEDASKEPYVLAKDGSIKDNWATPRARRQMLWARAISEAVRTLAPEIVSGIYTPEETHDFVDDAKPTAQPVDAEQLMKQAAAKADDSVIDAEFTVVPDGEKPGKCTPEQRATLRTLFDVVEASKEQIDKAMEKRGVKAMRYLTIEQANELIKTLQAKAEKVVEETTSKSKVPAEATTSSDTAPVSQVLVDEIKTLLKDDLELMKKIKQHLVANGCSKVADLCHHDAVELKTALEEKNLDTFFARSLVPFVSDSDQGSG